MRVNATHLGSPTRLIAGCAILLALASPSHASDPHPTLELRVAMASDADTRQSHNPADPTFNSAGDIWRLVHSAYPPRVEGQVDREAILATLAATTPESTDDDIAKEHELVLVGRRVMPSLSLRVVSYRVRGEASVASVVARLRADHRISSAQAGVVYRPVEMERAEAFEGPTRERTSARQAHLASAPEPSRSPAARSLVPSKKMLHSNQRHAVKKFTPARLSAAQRKCMDVQRTPSDYDFDLVELCGTL